MTENEMIEEQLERDTKVQEERKFQTELTTLLNCYSKENGSNTPDFLLAQYLIDCLEVYNKAVSRRDGWYNEDHSSVGTTN